MSRISATTGYDSKFLLTCKHIGVNHPLVPITLLFHRPSLLLLEKRKGTLDVSWGHVCNIGSPCSRSLLLLLLRKNTNEVSGGQISEALRLILILEPEKKRKLLYSVHALRLRQSCCNGGLVTIGCWRENCSEEQR